MTFEIFLVPPNETATVAITAINGGNSNNLIPEKVEMKGICRTFNNEIRKYIKSRIVEISTSIAKSMNGVAKVKFKPDNYPAVVNSVEAIKIIDEIAKNSMDENSIIRDYKTMCSDDFSYLLEQRPGAFVLVGCTDKEYYPQHSENFCVDIETILNATQLLYEIVKKMNF